MIMVDFMEKNQLYLLIILVVVGSFTVIAGFLLFTPQQKPIPIIGDAPSFVLSDETNQTVTLENYNGKVRVVDFIYTNCVDSDFCPLSTSKMVKLQDRLIEDGFDENDFHLISVSFDWKYDYPAVMNTYGTTYGADFASWSFLSGNKDQINDALEKYSILTFNSTMNNSDDETLLIHNMKFSIIDKNGNIRAEYSSNKWDKDEVYNIITRLIKE
ncbi:MAG: hypothetical protein HeimC3_27720 [Candidatus Heimdallarchaeota archaeon LC_3]|nr:MAG: hypothetical protein HeimC3_27720 [Candidatus Heimdallarchaeota archaeon LC_3]